MKSFMRWFYLFEAGIAGLGYAAVGLAMIADVFSREFFNYSIYGLQRSAVLLVIATAYIGMGLATAENKHLRPRFTDDWVPKRYQQTIGRLGDLLAAVMFATMGWFALELVRTSYEYGDRVNVIKFPMWTVQWVMAYGFFSSALRFLIFFIRPDLKPAEQETEQ